MVIAPLHPETRSQAAIDLVFNSLQYERLSDLSPILKQVAEAVDAFGAVLWQVQPDSLGSPKGMQPQLFVLGQWFADENHVHSVYRLPLEASKTGKAILTGEPQTVDDPDKDPDVFPDHPHLTRAGIRTICVLPTRFPDGSRGALNAYRKNLEPFGEQDVEELSQLASIVPRLYQGLADRVSGELVTKISSALPSSGPGPSVSFGDLTPALTRICDPVRETLECVDASIYLEREPGLYHLIGLSNGKLGGLARRLSQSSAGLSTWPIQNRRPLRLFDLAGLDRVRDAVRKEYPDLTWPEAPELVAAVQTKQMGPDSKVRVPVSYIAVPILRGERAVGAMQCVSALKGPSYFSEFDVKLLELVSNLVGAYWSNWLDRQESEAENASWRALVAGIDGLN